MVNKISIQLLKLKRNLSIAEKALMSYSASNFTTRGSVHILDIQSMESARKRYESVNLEYDKFIYRYLIKH